ncbi:hypothetical protein [Micromonospora sp. LOL_021]|uniref:hypothetical protein n=1 Tax=Micromonospora sp. LOL_021 TaxID=3345417 RepID=UPI003A8A5FEC
MRLVLRLGDASVECQLRPDGRYPTVAGADRPPRIHQATADQVFATELTRLTADAQSRISELTAELTVGAIAELIRQGGDTGRQAVLRLRLAEQELRLGRFGAAVDAIDDAASDAIDIAGQGAQLAEFRRQRDRLVETLDRVAGQLAEPVAESLHEAAELLRRRGCVGTPAVPAYRLAGRCPGPDGAATAVSGSLSYLVSGVAIGLASGLPGGDARGYPSSPTVVATTHRSGDASPDGAPVIAR